MCVCVSLSLSLSLSHFVCVCACVYMRVCVCVCVCLSLSLVLSFTHSVCLSLSLTPLPLCCPSSPRSPSLNKLMEKYLSHVISALRFSHITDPVVQVRVEWITEKPNTKHAKMHRKCPSSKVFKVDTTGYKRKRRKLGTHERDEAIYPPHILLRDGRLGGEGGRRKDKGKGGVGGTSCDRIGLM